MSAATTNLSIALDFNGQTIFKTQNNLHYYLAADGVNAYEMYGDNKELLGKIALTITPRKDLIGNDVAYTLTYEFEGADFISARLIEGTRRIAGTAFDEKTKAQLQDKITQGQITLHKTPNLVRPPYISRAAKNRDNYWLLLVDNLPDANGVIKRHGLFVVKDGVTKELTITQAIQGGSTFHFRTAEGIDVDMPYSLGGPSRGQCATANDVAFAYVDESHKLNMADFGIKVPELTPPAHYTPFYDLSAPSKPGSSPSAGASNAAGKPAAP